MDQNDMFGRTMVHEGKLFWSFMPSNPRPFSTPFFNNKKYSQSFLEIDMPCSLQDSAYNTLDLHHPQFVHAGLFGFGNGIPPKNVRHWFYKKIPDMVSLSFDYKTENRALSSANSNYTSNYHAFRFPSFTWSKVSFRDKEDKNKDLIISVDFLPLSTKMTRWYVTIVHNYEKTFYKQKLVDFLAWTILTQDREQMEKQAHEGTLKKKIMFQHTLGNEEGILFMKNYFDQHYQFPNENICSELLDAKDI
jgi:phenylpropionate dioxygenase-like ring-hydroxylating dioxygenase large terminal subunit